MLLYYAKNKQNKRMAAKNNKLVKYLSIYKVLIIIICINPSEIRRTVNVLVYRCGKY